MPRYLLICPFISRQQGRQHGLGLRLEGELAAEGATPGQFRSGATTAQSTRSPPAYVAPFETPLAPLANRLPSLGV